MMRFRGASPDSSRPRWRWALRSIANCGLMVLLAASPGSSEGAEESAPSWEVYTSPLNRTPYEIHVDRKARTKTFVGPTGETFGSIEEILAAESSGLSPLQRVVAPSLWGHLQSPTPSGDLVPVTIVLRNQPAHDASQVARERHAPRLAEALGRARRILGRLEPLLPSPEVRKRMTLRQLMEAEGALLTVEEKAELKAVREEVRATLGILRSEVLAQARSQAQADKAPIVAWLAATPGCRLVGDSTILSAVFAEVPGHVIETMVETFPEIARVSPIGRAEATMNTSTGTIGASDWWNAGYNGSSSTKVAVVDSGVDSGHPALSSVVSDAAVHLAYGKLLSVFNDSSTSTDDLHGHGTHVAGTVASTDSTYRGVAYGGLVMGAKCLFRTTTGGAGGVDPDIFSAMDWATDNGADVLNLSLGGSSSNGGESDIAHFCDAVAYGLVIPVAVASGNSGSSSGTVGTPGDAYNVITVGNFDDWDTTGHSDNILSSSSSRGPTSDGRRKPDLSAPGEDIASCNNTWEGAGSDFVNNSGTSMACPHVAGSCGILLDYASSWSPEALKALLVTTPRNTSPYPTSPDNNWGYGGLNLASAYAHRASIYEGTLTKTGPEFVFLKLGSMTAGDRSTLVWNRHVTSNNASAPTVYYSLLDLDLYLYDEATDTELDYSLSGLEPVEQCSVSSTVSSPVAKVYRYDSFPSAFSTEYFAFASETPTSPTLADPPELACTFTSLPSFVAASTSFTVTVQVTNQGDIRAFSPEVTLSIPTGYTVLSGANPRTLSNLSAGASTSVSWTVQSPSSGGTATFDAEAWTISYGELFYGDTVSQAMATDSAAPTGSVALDAGAAASQDLDVTLSINATDDRSGIAEMRIRNQGDSWPAWTAFSATVARTLPEGEAERTVEVQLRDAVGNVSATLSDSIYHDLTPPTGSVVVGGGAAYTNARPTPLTLDASDGVSGVQDMRFRTDGVNWGSWIPYAASTSLDLGSVDGAKTVDCQFRDRALNVSSTVQDGIVYDGTAPTGTLSVEDGAFFTGTSTVDLTISGLDSLSGLEGMRFRGWAADSDTWSSWVPFSTSHTMVLNAAQGLLTIGLQVRDYAGNMSTVASDGIYFDATPPTGTVLLLDDRAAINTTAIQVQMSWSDVGSSVEAYRLRNEGGSWTDWAPPTAVLPWDLPAADGVKRVEVEFRDLCGLVSSTLFDEILLDTVPPVGSFALNGGAGYLLPWEALEAVTTSEDTPDGSGVDGYRYSTDGGETWSAWSDLASDGVHEVTRPGAVHQVEVLGQFRDAAGNESVASAESIYFLKGDPQRLTFTPNIRGTTEPGGDHDAFTVDLGPGDLLDLKVSAKSSIKKGDFQLLVDVYAPDGTKVVDGLYPSSSKKVGVKKFPAPVAGQYWVVLRPLGADLDAGAYYTLKSKARMSKTRRVIAGSVTPAGVPPSAVVQITAADREQLSGTIQMAVLESIELHGPNDWTDPVSFTSKGYKRTLPSRTLGSGSGTYDLELFGNGLASYKFLLKPPVQDKALTEEEE